MKKLERNRLIAETMKLTIQKTNRGDFIEYVDNDGYGHRDKLDFDKSPRQKEWIEDWLVENGFDIEMDRDRNSTIYYIENLECEFVKGHKLKSEAFLLAVEECCKWLKKQNNEK